MPAPLAKGEPKSVELLCSHALPFRSAFMPLPKPRLRVLPAVAPSRKRSCFVCHHDQPAGRLSPLPHFPSCYATSAP